SNGPFPFPTLYTPKETETGNSLHRQQARSICPVKQKQALLRSNLPRDNWMRATKRRRPTPGRPKASPATSRDPVSEPSHASKNLPTDAPQTPLKPQSPFRRLGFGIGFAHLQRRPSVQLIVRHKLDPHAPARVGRQHPAKLLQ